MKYLLTYLILLLAFLTAASSWAAYPVREANGTTTDTEGDTTVLNMPAGIEAGNLLLAFCAHNSASVSLSQSGGSDWSRIDSGVTGSVSRAVFAKIAAGSDALTTDGAVNSDTACVVMRISGHSVVDVTTDIYKGTIASGSSVNPDPPNLAPAPGSADYLWLTGAFYRSDPVTSSHSTGYTAAGSVASGTGASAVRMSTAEKNATAASDDPDAIVITPSAEWIANTYAVPGVAEASAVDAGNAGAILLLLGR